MNNQEKLKELQKIDLYELYDQRDENAIIDFFEQAHKLEPVSIKILLEPFRKNPRTWQAITVYSDTVKIVARRTIYKLLNVDGCSQDLVDEIEEEYQALINAVAINYSKIR